MSRPAERQLGAIPEGRPGIPANARIRAEGRIHLGRRLELVQRPEGTLDSAFEFRVGLPEDGSIAPIDDLGPFRTPGELHVERLTWQLRPDDEELYIEAGGLTASYGIFGAPRSGKTHLLLHLLRQVFALEPENADRRYGGLILDPKAALVEDIRAAAEAAGRTRDLIVLNNDELQRLDEVVNIIDSELDPAELGRMLVLAAQSAGVAASEPFWFGAWSNLFGAVFQVLDWVSPEVLTLRLVMDDVLTVEPTGPEGVHERRIQRKIREAGPRLDELDDDRRRDIEMAINTIEGFYRQEPDNVATVESLMTQAYAGFLQSRWKRYSPRALKDVGAERVPLYDQIIDDGRIILVSVSPADPGMAKVICTLVKVLFQQAVLSRLARVRAGTLRNFERPVVLACDEYSDVASEVPGQPMGDGYFFSLARQNGAMGLLATQSVNMLQASSLKENWKAVFSNLGAKIFMRLADNETAEEATKLVGESDWYVTSAGSSQQKDGAGSSNQTDMRERKGLPSAVLTQVVAMGQGAVVGTLDGAVTRPTTAFLQVPAE